MNIIPGFPNYFATEDGRIWSTKGRGRFLKGTPSSKGYPTVKLRRGGEKYIRTVHSLVALSFLGPRPAGMEVCHQDGDQTNSCVRNLAYGTHRENMLDAVRHGTNHFANKTHCKRGHEFTPENTYVWAGFPTGRACRRCRNGLSVAHRARKRRMEKR